MTEDLKDQKLVDLALDLTGRTVERCRFDGCVLTLNVAPMERSTFIDAVFVDCQMVGDGWSWLEMERVDV